ncbi:MAG: response regulator transcription factor, partial [Acidobacteriota bacterium]
AVVVLTGTTVEDEVLDAIEAGALGYLAKSSPLQDFLEAIHCVARGDSWLPTGLTGRLVTRLKLRPVPEAPKPLTERENAVLALIARGWSNRRIAQELSISDVTVRTHVSHVLAKLGVSNRVEAALYALRPIPRP